MDFCTGGGGLRGGLGNFAKFIYFRPRGLFDKGRLLAPLVRSPKTGAFSLGRAALTGLAGTAIAAPFFMGGDDDEEEEIIETIDRSWNVRQ